MFAAGVCGSYIKRKQADSLKNGPPAGQGSVNGEWREGVLMQDEIFDAFADPLLSKVYFSPFFALLPLLPHLFGLCLYSNRTVWSN